MLSLIIIVNSDKVVNYLQEEEALYGDYQLVYDRKK